LIKHHNNARYAFPTSVQMSNSIPLHLYYYNVELLNYSGIPVYVHTFPITASSPIKTRTRVPRSKGCYEIHTSGTNSSVASSAL